MGRITGVDKVTEPVFKQHRSCRHYKHLDLVLLACSFLILLTSDYHEKITMTFSPVRDAKTTLACGTCGEPLHITRTCHDVYMNCPACSAQFPLQKYIRQADAAMEQFLENVHCDRI